MIKIDAEFYRAPATGGSPRGPSVGSLGGAEIQTMKNQNNATTSAATCAYNCNTIVDGMYLTYCFCLQLHDK
jgi:hypothetical protein